MAKILIIDDDNDVAKALQAALQFVGNQVETATEPEEALLRAGREDFDLVITDLHWGIPGSKRHEEKGMDLVESFYNSYGEMASRGGQGPDPSRIEIEGNDYLADRFPRLDYIRKASVQ